MSFENSGKSVTALIEQKLCEIEEKEQVRILHAVESGSRAWGFASPDSDYDVRFIYVRTEEDYLKLNPQRDVIEWELNEVLDINGWDIKKVLQQYYKSNSVLYEWAASPVVYRTTEEWKQIHKYASAYFSFKAVLYHYYGMAKKNYLDYLQGEQVNYKKYFYILRPVFACIWLEEKNSPPPVLFEELANAVLQESLKESQNHLIKPEIQKRVKEALEQLLEIKKKSPESKTGKRILVLDQFIEERLDYDKNYLEHSSDAEKTKQWEGLNELFLKIIKKKL